VTGRFELRFGMVDREEQEGSKGLMEGRCIVEKTFKGFVT
jgi:hypothetical protein